MSAATTANEDAANLIEVGALVAADDFRPRATSWPDRARSIAIESQGQYEGAALLLREIKSLREEIGATFDPMQSRAHAAWKEVIAQRKVVEDPLSEAEREIKRRMGAYVEAEERRLREEQRRIEAEARRAEEDRRVAEAAELEAAGEPEQAEAVLSAPTPIAVAPPIPMAPKAAGVAPRKVYRARVTDLAKLVRAVAEGRAQLGLVLANQSALDKLASALKDTLAIDGVEVVVETQIAARAR